jgi:hypothetical protein
MEFESIHDTKVDNIPISLELRNLPSTIQSLAQIHGLSMSSGVLTNVHQVEDTPVDCTDDDDGIHLIGDKKPKPMPSCKSPPPSTSLSDRKTSLMVQCWLCDGPHNFRPCKDIARMKSVCIKRPNVLKHFQQMLLDRNGQAIRVLLDAPEFFDSSTFVDGDEKKIFQILMMTPPIALMKMRI